MSPHSATHIHSRYTLTLASPTSLDVAFAAHIHLLDARQPDPLFSKLIEASYPSLFAHCNRVFAVAFAEEFPCTVTHSTGFSFRSIFPRIPAARPRQKLESPAWDAQERKFRLMRWGFFGGVALSVGSYLYFGGVIGMYLESMRKFRAIFDAAGAEAGKEEESDEDEDEEDEEDEEVEIEAEVEAEMGSEV